MAGMVDADEVEKAQELEDAFKPEVYEKVLRYSLRRCRWLQRLGLPVDSGSVEQFVMDAISDTVLGTRRWDPPACSLETHLFGVIRSRTSDLWRHHKKFRHDRIDHHDEDDAASAPVSSGNPDPEAHVVNGDLIIRLVKSLEEVVGEDEDVQLLLLAYEDGCAGRAEIIQELGWQDSDYDNARRRLNRALKRLPHDLKDDVNAMLGGSR